MKTQRTTPAPVAWLTDRIAEADMRGSNWLAEGNAAAERGDKANAERCYAKGQFWMDRSNTLRERLDVLFAKATRGAA